MNVNAKVMTAVRRSVATPVASVASASILHRPAGYKARPMTASFNQDFSRVRAHTVSDVAGPADDRGNPVPASPVTTTVGTPKFSSKRADTRRMAIERGVDLDSAGQDRSAGRSAHPARDCAEEASRLPVQWGGPATQGALTLQRTAGNAVVQRSSEEAVDLGDTAMDDLADSELIGPQPVVQTLRNEVSVSRQAISVHRHPCPPYDGYSATYPLASFNCAGLAHRTYDYKSLADTKSLLSGGTQCAAGKVKHWLWEFDLHIEDGAGRRATQPWRDFHTVAGVVRPGGADPVDVFSKNGKRPIYGPGTGPGFRPPARDRATNNIPSETPLTDRAGNPLFKVRYNFAGSIRCLNCPSQTPPLQGPPPPP